MITLTDRLSKSSLIESATHDFTEPACDRRRYRRAELETREIRVNQWEGSSRIAASFGRIVDLSAGGIRIRSKRKDIRPDAQIRVELELPEYAGISPFIDRVGRTPKPSRKWIGWMAVNRVIEKDRNESEIAGRLVDMNEMDRGMLSLYLSTHPLAA